MSVASEFEIQRQLITNAYNKLDNLGIDSTGVDKNIENISEMLDTVYNDYPKVPGTGTSVTLNGTKKGKLSLDIKGNSTQETTTGKNLCSNKANNAVIAILSAGTYTFSLKTSINGGYTLKKDNARGTNLANQQYITANTLSTITFTINEATNVFINGYSTDSGKTFLDNTIQWQLEKGSTSTSYEPYTGGIASPNPNYEQPILSAGDEGTISEKIVNKNLANTIMTVNLTSGNEKWRAISLTTENSGIIWEQGKTYYICAFLDKQSNETVQITNYGYASIDNRVVSITFNGAIPYVRVGANTLNGNIVDEEVKIMVATSSFTDFVAHQEQTYTIPVQQPMRSIGTVRDEFIENKERHKIYRYTFTGNETNMYKESVGTNMYVWSVPVRYFTKNDSVQIISNYFTGVSYNNRTSSTTNMVYCDTNGTRINFRNTDFATLEELKTFLSNKYASGNPVYIDYVLETPTNLPCTAEQISILENLPKSYNEQTNIYSLDVTPAYIEAKALKGE